MRILLLYNTMDLPETLLLKGLCEEDRSLSLEVLCNTKQGYHHLLQNTGIQVSSFRCSNRLDLRAIYKVRQQIKNNQYDIIHAFTAKTLSVVLFASMGIKPQPKIIAYRGAIGNISRLDPTAWLTYLNPRICKINCVSKAVETYLQGHGVSSEKLITIYKGHDLCWYENKGKADLSAFGIPQDAFVIGCVANMRRTKGIDLLIEAAHSLSSSGSLHFLLVGAVRDKSLLRMAEDPKISQRIHFAGFREDASALAGACDLFVMPSRDREGLPKGVIEAMAQGVVPVVTRIGGMPELVTDGIDGFVVDSENVEQLVSAIDKLCRDPELRQRFGQAAKEKIRSSFNAQQTVIETLSLYHRVAGSFKDNPVSDASAVG